jgi:hypothetical protein
LITKIHTLEQRIQDLEQLKKFEVVTKPKVFGGEFK